MFKVTATSAAALLAGLTVVGCSPGRRAAEAELTAARDGLAAIDVEAREYVADQVSAIQASIDSATALFETGAYQDALTLARDANTKATALPGAVVQRKAELEASWSVLRDSIPAMLQQLQTQVDQLSGARRLPSGVTRPQVNDAKTTLQTLSETWAEAVRESEDGRWPAAVTKADAVRTGVRQLMQSLGLVAT